jgi:hypothetical protein
MSEDEVAEMNETMEVLDQATISTAEDYKKVVAKAI